MLKEEIRRLSDEWFAAVVRDRRHLHAHPELSFREYKTSEYVKSRLDEIGIPWKPMADTGVVGIIKGEKTSGDVIALRADMDALPITEENKVDYVSRNSGVMHACGHDAHTASLLGTAGILQSLKSRFGGTIKLIFQPGEERLPGGASLMIREGVLDNPRPAHIIAQHTMPAIEAGKIGIRAGKHMASVDELRMTVHGKGGHGAQPAENIDPVLISAYILVALQQIVSRAAQPTVPTVLSFGKVIANGATNVIPDKVFMEGTFRTLDEAWRTEAHARMKKIAEGIAESMGGRCELDILRGYPFLVNEPALTKNLGVLAEEYLGKENVVNLDIWMAAEDFAYYSQQIDACFYLLGTGNKERGITSSLHTPTYDIDEKALAQSTGLMAWLAIKQLGN
ncbi:MAG: M20 family metallopeptidase [Puia sp.]|nr:M20 family metallopeptidase [Puia sp.]